MDISEMKIVDFDNNEKFFEPYYDEKIKPFLAEFEKKYEDAENEKNRRMGKIKFIVPLVAVTTFTLFFYLQSQNLISSDEWFKLPIILTIATLIGLFIWGCVPQQGFKSNIKKDIFPIIFKFFGENFTYKTHEISLADAYKKENIHYIGKKDAVSEYKPSGIIPISTERKLDDHIMGEYAGVGIEILEAGLITHRKGKSNKPSYSFKGLFIHLSMNKSFSGKTILRADKGGIGNWLQDNTTKYENVKLEDITFEKEFEVFGTDQIEARYLLTPAFMQRIVNLKSLFTGGKGKFQVSFYDNRILIMIPSDPMFEIKKIEPPVTFHNEIKTILDEMQSVFAIIKELKINENIGV